jgi:SagB-type dehydrogenase family enzyme
MLQSALGGTQVGAEEEMRAPAEVMRSRAGSTSPFEITLYEDVITDYVFDTDLLVDGPRETKTSQWMGTPAPLADDARPMLAPCARACPDEDGAVRLRLPPEEPTFDRHPGCILMRRIRCDVVVSGNSAILWNLIRESDGSRSVGAILSELGADKRAIAGRMLGALAAIGAIDISGRPMGRFLHSATKKGVLPGGGLESDDVLRLATDANYRSYPGSPRIPIRQTAPDRLRSFHSLTRARRSRRDYQGRALRREDFDALLYVACGVTGTMTWAGREVKLRAYPASGALYAVEIYPVVFRVDGLEPAIYHYRAVESVLELVKPASNQTRFVGAMLPVERQMVAGAAATICLTGLFPRHERKYGEGGYRMLVAEAGHISQNLILAATALGLSARPFGGVFDDLVNQDLGLNTAEEQFLLAVLVGHASHALDEK